MGQLQVGVPSFTIGFAAVRNGNAGFVIPGHVSLGGYGVDDNVYYNGLIAGKIKAIQFGGTVDAAFVECRTGLFVVNHYPSKKFMNNDVYYQTAINPAYLMVGLIVKSYEGVSGVQEGVVQSTNIALVVDGVTFTNVVQANYQSIFGDSGSAVTYTHWAGGTNYVRNVLGTQFATALVNGEWVDGESFSLLTRVDYIHSALGLAYYD